MLAKKNRQLPRHSVSQLRVENSACHFDLLIMNRTRSTNETSCAERRAYPPTIPVAPTITSRVCHTLGAFSDGLEAFFEDTRLVTVMTVRALPASRRRAGAPQTATSRPSYSRSTLEYLNPLQGACGSPVIPLITTRPPDFVRPCDARWRSVPGSQSFVCLILKLD
jgi:hypothetical protein